MWSTKVAALLLLFAVTSISGDAVKFPFVFGEASAENEDPHLSAVKVAETIMKEVVDSYLHVFRHSDHQNMTLFIGDFLENLLVKAEPYIDVMSETGLVLCWLKKALRAMVSCCDHVDMEFQTMFENNMDILMTFNFEGFLRCYSKVFQEKHCFQMYSELFGSTPAMLRQSKGIFICMINELVIATTAC